MRISNLFLRCQAFYLRVCLLFIQLRCFLSDQLLSVVTVRLPTSRSKSVWTVQHMYYRRPATRVFRLFISLPIANPIIQQVCISLPQLLPKRLILSTSFTPHLTHSHSKCLLKQIEFTLFVLFFTQQFSRCFLHCCTLIRPDSHLCRTHSMLLTNIEHAWIITSLFPSFVRCKS